MKPFGPRASGKGQKHPTRVLGGGASFLFPGPEGWEYWSGTPAQQVCVGPAEQPGKLRPESGCTMGLPSACFFSLPLWVPVVEDSPAREQTQIRLEMKGLLGANPETAIWDFEAIRRESLPASGEEDSMQRQLESTAVLAGGLQEEWLIEEATRYEPAGRILPAPGSGSLGVLRRELGRWVADFYVGGKWLHTQPLLALKLDASAAVELAGTVAQLEGEGIFSGLEGWLIRDGSDSGDEGFRQVLEVSPRVENRSPPQEPGLTWNLPPPALTERRAEKARSLQKKQWIRAGLLAYLAVGFVVLTVLSWPLVRLRLGQAELNRIGPEADAIRSTATLWREAGPWLEPRHNVLELLWQVSRPLIETDPPAIEGVRITLFDLGPKRLLLQGEGKDLEKVEKYLQWLKNEKALAGFTWKNPQPRLLPNGNAQFQTEGLPPGVAPEEEEGGTRENADGS